ncbi:B-lymphocyte antigen CD20 [Camelus dromedarius]|uniref:B-lymphocyte antigen CD20 n=1 Tax=Camelus dromedarius TaxID=9838 RepID=A0A5N4DNP6_CAMDR|nr:B-lymphocyte antigen CD20 [Camelus dromedarius]
MTTPRNSMTGAVPADPMKGPISMYPVQRRIPRRVPSMVGPTQGFFLRESKALGAVQIMNGLFHIAIGGFLLIHMEVYVPICVILWYPFWGGIMFIISGSLLAAAAEKNSRESLASDRYGIFALLLIFALCQKLVTAGIVETEWKKMCSRRKANIVLLSAEEKKEQAIEIKEEVVEQPEIAPQPKNEEDIEIIPVQEEEEETEINFPEPPEEQESSPTENDGAP